MFFFFSKILSFVFSPIIWILVFGVLAIFAKKPNRKRNFIIVAFSLLILFSNQFILNEVLRKWEIIPTVPTKKEKFDYVIVLGGFSKFEESQSRMQLTGAGDRIWQAYRLFKENQAYKLFIAGGSGKLLHQDQTEADKVKTYLLKLRVPEKDIIIEALSKNTRENAQFTMEWIKKHDQGAKCIMVTSASHMRRALGCFKKFDTQITGFSADIQSDVRKFDIDILIKPNAQTLSDWDGLIKEMIGTLMYKIMGYC